MSSDHSEERDVSASGEDPTIGVETLAVPARKRLRDGELILDRYRVMGELGQGGMGVVYRCHDEIGGIDVALKALPPEVSRNSSEMEEIRENFRLVEKLHHPNIADLKTLERNSATGEYYVIMECAQGVNLRQYRKQQGGRLTLEQLLPVLRQVAWALDYAHGQLVMHRDVKPSNVVVAPDGTVKVLDFGLAAQIHTSFSRVTMVHYGTSGTAPYMAPEQWRGQYQDASTDQYALGVMTYELLVGHCPFETHDIAVLREAALKDTPTKIEGLSPVAWQALSRALAKDRKLRFATCAEFVSAIEKGRTLRAEVAPQRRMWIGRTAKIAALVTVATSLVLLTVRVASHALDAHNQRMMSGVAPIKTEAESAWDALQRRKLDPGQTMGTRILTISQCLNTGAAACENGRWRDAITQYRKALELIKDVETRETARTNASAARTKSITARDQARLTLADTLAKESWDTAVAAANKASQNFENGDFSAALTGYSSSLTTFAQAERVAAATRAKRLFQSEYGGDSSPLARLIKRHAPETWQRLQRQLQTADSAPLDATTSQSAYKAALSILQQGALEAERNRARYAGETARLRDQAEAEYDRVRTLAPEQGFAGLLAAIAGDLRAGRDAATAENWPEANTRFAAVTGACPTLIVRDTERTTALEARKTTEVAFAQASRDELSRHAAPALSQATELNTHAADSFEKGEFAQACTQWNSAARILSDAGRTMNKARQQAAVTAWKAAKAKFETALNSTDVTAVKTHAPAQWQATVTSRTLAEAQSNTAFPDARTYEAALSALNEAIEAMKAAKTAQHQALISGMIAEAHAAKANREWSHVAKSARQVLTLEPGNPEAGTLIKEAEAALSPTLLVVVFAGEAEARGALIRVGSRRWVTPATLLLESGKTYDVEVLPTEYRGHQYLPSTSHVTADWEGQRSLRIRLVEQPPEENIQPRPRIH